MSQESKKLLNQRMVLEQEERHKEERKALREEAHYRDLWREDDGKCEKREDGIHCSHWWEGLEPCCTCGQNKGPNDCNPLKTMTVEPAQSTPWEEAQRRLQRKLEQLDEAMADPERVAQDTKEVGGFVSTLDITETDEQIIDRAIELIKSLKADRLERVEARFLLDHGYVEMAPGLWKEPHPPGPERDRRVLKQDHAVNSLKMRLRAIAKARAGTTE